MEVWAVNWSGDYDDCDAVWSSFDKGVEDILNRAKDMRLENFHPADESISEKLWKIWEFNDDEEPNGIGNVIIQKYTVDGYNH